MNAALAAIQEAAYNCLREHRHVDVIFDPMSDCALIDALENALQETSSAQAAVEILALSDPQFRDATDKAPHLIRLQWQHAPALDWFLAKALEESADPDCTVRSVCAFVFSPLPQKTLMQRLSQRLEAVSPARRPVYLRYFDPRVLHHLPRILKGPAWTALAHGIAEWAYLDWRSQWRCLRNEAHDKALDTDELWINAERLNEAQWRHLNYIEALNLALRAALKEEGADQESAHRFVLPKEADQRALEAVVAADKAGLTAVEDQTTYAALALRWGWAFTQSPKLSEAVATARDNRIALADVLDQGFGINMQSIGEAAPSNASLRGEPSTHQTDRARP